MFAHVGATLPVIAVYYVELFNCSSLETVIDMEAGIIICFDLSLWSVAV